MKKPDTTAVTRQLLYSGWEWISERIETKDNLMEFLTSYVAEHPEVDINTIVPNEDNIKRVLEVI